MTTRRNKGEICAQFELGLFDERVIITVDGRGALFTDRNVDLLSVDLQRIDPRLERHIQLVGWNRFVRAVTLGLVPLCEVEEAWGDFCRSLTDDDFAKDGLADLYPLLRAFHPFWPLRRSAAADENSPEAVMQELATDPAVEVRLELALNQACDPAILALLATDRSFGVRCAVASNAAAPATVLERLVPSEDAQEDMMSSGSTGTTQLFECLALNPSSPPSVLAAIAHGPMSSDATKQFVAEHPATSRATVLRMAEDGVGCASGHPALSRDDLAVLVASDWPPTRAGVVDSPHVDSELLWMLVGDEDTSVRSAVARCERATPEMLDQLAVDIQAEVRAAVAQNKMATSGLLVQLASDADGHVRQGVARNPSITGGLLRVLAMDDWALVRREVVCNRQALAFPWLIELLANDKDPHVRRAVASRGYGTE